MNTNGKFQHKVICHKSIYLIYFLYAAIILYSILFIAFKIVSADIGRSKLLNTGHRFSQFVSHKPIHYDTDNNGSKYLVLKTDDHTFNAIQTISPCFQNNTRIERLFIFIYNHIITF